MTVSATPTAPKPSRSRTRWWNHWYSLTVLLGASLAAWAAAVGWLSDGDTTVLPRHLNTIMLTGLGCGTIMAFIAAGNQNRRERDTEWQTLVLAAIDELRHSSGGGEPTVDLGGRHRPGRRAVYASAAVHGGQVDVVASALGRYTGECLDRIRAEAGALMREFDKQLDSRIGDVRALLQHERDLHGVRAAGGSVTPLAPRARS